MSTPVRRSAVDIEDVRAPAGAATRPRAVTPLAQRSPQTLVWLALGIVYVVWGSTYLGIRIAVETMPALIMGGVRFMLAGVVLLLVVRVRSGAGAVRLSRRELAWSALIGSLLVCGGNGLVNVAEQYIPSGIAALVISSVPLWVVVFRRLTGDRVPRLTLASVVLGFGGVALLLSPQIGNGGSKVLGYVLVLAAAFSWASGSFMSGRATLPRNPLLSTSIQMIAGGLLSLVLGVATGELASTHPGSFSARSIGAFAYLVLVGSLVAYTAYVWVLQHAPISKVATYAYVNPVIAIFLGWAVLSENVALTTLLGAAVVVSSVAVTVRRESG